MERVWRCGWGWGWGWGCSSSLSGLAVCSEWWALVGALQAARVYTGDTCLFPYKEIVALHSVIENTLFFSVSL